MNRIMIAADKSGSGKTTITLALLKTLKKEGIDVRSFKCGPDYIDPMFHKSVLQIPSRNLDSFFMSEDEIIRAVNDDELDNESAAIIEGVMGIYDGIGGISSQGSAYDIARITKTPIILIVDANGSGRTVISVIKGILIDDTDKLIKGIILNRTSEGFYKTIKPVIEEVIGISVLGFFPKLQDQSFESRHLGLILPNEVFKLNEKIDNLCEVFKKSVDSKAILNIMSSAADITPVSASNSAARDVAFADYKDTKLRLAVALDEAFCFYYEANLECFRDRNVEIVPFSPIHDEKLPENIDGILLGGGYPELYLEELSENIPIKKAIRAAIDNGMPSLAECGGFMYLQKSIISDAGMSYEMVGCLPGDCKNAGRLGRFGYVDLYLSDGKIIKAHEFHYYDCSDNGSDAIARKPMGSKEWECCFYGDNHLWGYPHLYYNSCKEFINSFVKSMKIYYDSRQNAKS